MKFQKLIFILFLVSMSLIVIVSVPNLKRATKDIFLSDKRTILGKIQGKVNELSPRFVILKIKQKDELFIEVFAEDEKNEHLNFVQKIVLPEKNEGSFTFKGELTNLAFADIDQDENLEILVPAFDKDMTPRLHTFKYNSTSLQFETIRSE